MTLTDGGQDGIEGDGDDTIDLSGHSGTIDVTGAGTVLTSSVAGNSLTQTGGKIAEEIDYTLVSSAPAKDALDTAFDGVFDDLNSFVGDLVNGADGVAELLNQLPFLSSVSNTVERGIAEVVAFTDAIQELVDHAQSVIDGLPDTLTLSDIVGAINSGPAISPVGIIDSFDLVATTSYRGESANVSGGNPDQLEVLLDLSFEALIQDETYSLSLGEDITNLGFNLSAGVEVDARVGADFSIGFSTDPTPDVFLVPGATVTLALDDSDSNTAATASFSATDLNLGILALNMSGSLTLDGAVIVELLDFDGTDDGRLNFSSLPSDINSAVNVTFDDGGDGYVTNSFTVTADEGVSVAGLDDLADAVGGINLSFDLPSGENPFGGLAGFVVPEVSLEADFGGGNVIDLLNFGNLSPQEMLGMLGGVLDAFIALTDSQFLNTPIPFTDLTLGEAIDLGESFKATVLDPLFVSGNALMPDSNGDGFIGLPGFDNDGDGDVDGADDALADVTFGSIQDLIDDLATNLGLPDFDAIYDAASGELAFPMSFAEMFMDTVAVNFGASLGDFADFQTFGDLQFNADVNGALTFGVNLAPSDAIEVTPAVFAPENNVTVTVGNAGDAGTPASFGIEISAEEGDAYTLVYRDVGGAGSPQFYTVASYSEATAEADILTALNALTGFPAVTTGTGATEILVTTNSPRSFAVNFEENGERLLAGLSESGILQSNATFELGLFNEPAIGIAASDGGATTNETQDIHILNATGGDFTLSYGGIETAPITYNPGGLVAVAGAMQTALEGLPGIGSGNVAVSETGGIFTVTFQGALANTNVDTLVADSNGLVNNTPLVSPFTVTVTTANTEDNASVTDLAEDAQRAIDKALHTAGLGIGFDPTPSSEPGYFTTGTISDGGNVTTDTVPFNGTGDLLPNDIRLTVIQGSNEFQTRLRAAQANQLGLDVALENAVNGAIPGDTISINASIISGGPDDGKLNIIANGGSVEVRFDTGIRATSGGGRVSISAPSVYTSFDTLEPAVEADRRLQLSVDYANPAYQQMGLSGSPTRFDGVTGDTIEFDLQLTAGGMDYVAEVMLASTDPTYPTTDNNSVADLVADLQGAVNQALTDAGLAPGAGTELDPYVLKVVQGGADPDNPNGNRIKIVGLEGTVTKLAIDVPDNPANGAITELGFEAGQGETKRAKATQFFFEDVTFNGGFTIDEIDVGASASLGFLGVTADVGSGLESVPDTRVFDATFDFALRNPTSLTIDPTRVTLDDIAATLREGQFLFDAAELQGALGEAGATDPLAAPATGVVDGIIAGGLGFDLGIRPDGALAGIAEFLDAGGNLANLLLAAQSPNWLEAIPTLSNPFELPDENQNIDGPTVTAGQPLPANGVLSSDLAIVVSQTFDESLGSEVIIDRLAIVKAEDTTENTTRADLVTQVQAAVDDALTRIKDAAALITTPITFTTDATITVGETGGALTFAGNAGDSSATTEGLELRGNLVKLAFDTDIDDVLEQIQNIDFGDFFTVLNLVVDFLRGLQGSAGADNPFQNVADSVLTFEIPVLNRSIGDLIDIGGEFLDFAEQLINNPAGSLQLLEGQLRALFGLPDFGDPFGLAQSLFDLGTSEIDLGGLGTFDFGLDIPALGNLTSDFSFLLDIAGKEALIELGAADFGSVAAFRGAAGCHQRRHHRTLDWTLGWRHHSGRHRQCTNTRHRSRRHGVGEDQALQHHRLRFRVENTDARSQLRLRDLDRAALQPRPFRPLAGVATGADKPGGRGCKREPDGRGRGEPRTGARPRPRSER